MAKNHAPDRPGEESDGVGRKRRHHSRPRVERGEEELVEHQRGGGAVEEEVVPLDGRADEAGGGDFEDFRTAFQVAVAWGNRGGHDASVNTRVPEIMTHGWRDGNRPLAVATDIRYTCRR